MDPQKFDDLIRSITTTRLTRLTALRGMVAGAAAAVTGASLVSEADAAKKKQKSKSKKKGKKKGAKKKGTTQRTATNGGAGEGGGGGNLSAQALTCATPTSTGTTVTPGGNQATCTVSGGSLKIDSGDFRPGECGPITDPCGCELEWCVSADGKEVSFHPVEGKLACTISQVVVKGGPAANIYTFNPAVICATGLVAPNNSSGGPAGVSHFDFCGIACCVPLTCQTAGGDVACGDDVDDQCNGTIDCTCPGDNNGCTTETCSQPTPGAAGTCSSTNVTCNPTNGCEENCQCVSTGPTTHRCDCDEVQCIPGECEENCQCVSTGPTTHRCDCDDICPECASSCTLGYYSQNQCVWPTETGINPSDRFPCQPATGTLTYAQALLCRGGRGSCSTLQAQQAAAILNLAAFDCLADPDVDTEAEICAITSTDRLDSFNRHDKACCSTDSCANPAVDCPGRTCPLRGCGNR